MKDVGHTGLTNCIIANIYVLNCYVEVLLLFLVYVTTPYKLKLYNYCDIRMPVIVVYWARVYYYDLIT